MCSRYPTGYARNDGYERWVVMAEKRDMIDALIHDHREVEEMFVELESTENSPERVRELTDNVITELVRHSVAEEQYLYPTTRKALPGGDALADREIEEHAAAERTMKQLDGMDPSDPAFNGLLAELITDIGGDGPPEGEDPFPPPRGAGGAEEVEGAGHNNQQ